MANKYIIGYTAVEYDINGILVPKRSYTEFEKQHGKKAYTEVTEEQLAVLQNCSVFNTLIANKMVRVLDHIPGFALSGEDRANKKLEEANRKLEESNNKVEESTKEIEKLKAELLSAKKELGRLKKQQYIVGEAIVEDEQPTVEETIVVDEQATVE